MKHLELFLNILSPQILTIYSDTEILVRYYPTSVFTGICQYITEPSIKIIDELKNYVHLDKYWVFQYRKISGSVILEFRYKITNEFEPSYARDNRISKILSESIKEITFFQNIDYIAVDS